MARNEDRGWNIYQRRDGQHVLQFRIGPRGSEWRETRVPREYRNEKQAERYAVSWLTEYKTNLGRRPVVSEPPAGERPVTLRDLAGTWIELRKSDPKLSSAIVAQNDSNMDTHVLPHADVADVPIVDLGPAALRAWVRKVRDHGLVTRTRVKTPEGKDATRETRRPLAPMTVRNVVGTLTQFFDDAMAEEWASIPANPMRHPGVRKEIPEGITRAEQRGMRRGEKAHLTRDQADRLLACKAVPEDRRVLYALTMTSGGFRPGEAYALTWGDMELDAPIPCVSITKAVGKLRGTGPKEFESGKTKTPDAVRTNPLHHLALRLLRAWKAGGWTRLVGRHPKPTDLIFPSREGKLQRPRDADRFRADLEIAGCATKYGIEDLTYKDGTRHSFATWLGAAGVPDELIGRLLGHSARSVTRRHYVGDDLAVLQEAIEKIGLEVSADQVLAQPLAVGGGGAPHADHRYKLTAELTAGLTAGRGKRGARRTPNLLKLIGIGGVAEWSKAPVLKTGDLARDP
jgi:integrase